MPRLPTVDDLGARPTPFSNRRIVSNPGAGVVGNALEGFGQTVSRVGAQIVEKQDKIAYAAAKAAVLTADITAREELREDPDFATWEQRYTAKMKAATEAASKMIGNAGDRKLFGADVNNDLARGTAEIRKSVFARRASTEVATGYDALQLMSDNGQNAPDDATREAVIVTASDLINGLRDKGYIDPVQAGEMRRSWTQNYINQRFQSQLMQGDVDGAGKWLEANRGRLDAQAEIRLTQQHHDAQENRANIAAVDHVVGSDPGVASGAPADLSRMVPITIHTESRGDPNAVSPKGARGQMQVMPGSGRDPGFGVRPWDGTAADNVRFGTDYLGKMMERYGNDPAKAWAAYNAGPGRLDKAISSHGANWLSHMPAETRAYVAKNMAALGGGSGDRRHDLQSIYASIDTMAAQQGWTPERREKVKAMAAARVDRDETILRREQDDIFNRALAKADVLGNGFTDVSQLGDDFYKASATDQHRLRAMADANATAQAAGPKANGDVVRALHVMAIEAPGQLAQANLAQYKPFMTAGEFDEISAAQAKARSGAGQWNPRAGIQEAITWGEKFGGVELKNASDRFRVYRYMEDRARTWSAQNGGKVPADNEFQTFFREATQQVKVTRSFLGIDALAPDTTSRAYELPSGPIKARIISRFRSTYRRDPSPAEIQQWFDRMGEPLK